MKRLRQEKTKKAACVLVSGLILGSASLLLAQENSLGSWAKDDVKIIRRAVGKANSSYPAAQDYSPRWLKIQIVNREHPAKEIKITLPIALIDWLVVKAEMRERGKVTSDRPGRQRQDDFSFLREGKWRQVGLNFLDFWREIKKLSPCSVVEMKTEEGVFLIWLE